MKIAFVSDSIYPYHKGGKEKRLYELSTRLSRMGHDVHVYSMKWWDGPNERAEDGVTLHGISKLHKLYTGDRRSIKQGVFFGFACFRLMSEDFDILDVDHMPFFPIFSSWIVCKLKRRKLNGTWHEALRRSDWTDYMGFVGNIAALLERVAIRLPHTVTAGSAHTFDLIQSELKRTKRLEMVPSGIDVSSLQKVSPSKTKCDVLFVGRLVKDKNVALLVRAIALLRDQGHQVECSIIGTGIEENNIIKLIKKHQLQNSVKLLGSLPHAEDVYALMKTAKILALPSKREGFGIVALEALACGTPVITTDLPANASKQLIEEGVNGSVVHATPSGLALAINTWLDKTPEIKAMTRQVADYDWKKIAGRQLKVYGT